MVSRIQATEALRTGGTGVRLPLDPVCRKLTPRDPSGRARSLRASVKDRGGDAAASDDEDDEDSGSGKKTPDRKSRSSSAKKIPAKKTAAKKAPAKNPEARRWCGEGGNIWVRATKY